MEELQEKASNYYVLGVIAQSLSMKSEAATNFFKALFAVDDMALKTKIAHIPKDHTERFYLLKSNIPELYIITDKLFSLYRRTYTQELSNEELELIRNRIEEAFQNAKITLPTAQEIKERIKKLSQKGI